MSLILSLGITYFTVPIIRKFGLKYGYLDKSSERKRDERNLVRIGGLAIVTGFITTNIILFLLNFFVFKNSYLSLNIYYLGLESFIPLIIISLIFFSVGFIDDILDISFILRLSVQIILSFIAFNYNISLLTIRSPEILNYSIILDLPFIISFFVTVIWLTGITNSFNWIDGLDGLAGGIAIISLSSLAIFNFNNGNIPASISAITLIGACIAFLKFNFKNASILMGDGGSYFIGFFIAGLILKSYTLDKNYLDFISLIFFIGVPLFDMSFVILRRILNKQSIFKPDRRHIHHILLDKGMSPKETVLTIYSFSLFSSGIGLIISNNLTYGLSFIATGFLLISLFKNKKQIK